ncbi:unnamed protein product [Sphenostylis stenocarpa]|uniref:Nucleotide-diphospho-sugar transferase domain-containing protein n=1 Tax=Sphenostylis stenocarpa TaxID=92480 RepID=A0AA86SVY5_9FABA|nr:unnamed protein product [Sphenostylis stenocarpa]
MVKCGSEYTIVDFQWFDDCMAESDSNRQHLISRQDRKEGGSSSRIEGSSLPHPNSVRQTMKDNTPNSPGKNNAAGDNNPWNPGNHLSVRWVMQFTMFLALFAVLCMFLFISASPFQSPTFSHLTAVSKEFERIEREENGTRRDWILEFWSMKGVDFGVLADPDRRLENILKEASMEDKTVIITTLNDAWAEPGSIFDLFLESFRLGNQTQRLLNHLVVITYDQHTHGRCLAMHKYCYLAENKEGNFTGEMFYMSPNYLQLIWGRAKFLCSVLELGYNFLFTDTDIMWLRDPFSLLDEDADFQIACDFFNGNSSDISNFPNGGFKFMRSNARTIWFIKFWINARIYFPGFGEQAVFNMIKLHPLISVMKVKIRFLSTDYFGGFCQPSRDLNQVSTMHANCCVGIDNKINDLKILLEDWKKYIALSEFDRLRFNSSWTVPQRCGMPDPPPIPAEPLPEDHNPMQNIPQ